ncbi:MAG: hypothetical protein ACE5Q4_04475, partial [Nitrosopumilus sp.]|jgi:hypothetical protein
MTDLVVGLGEIGRPLFELLRDRNFKVEGFDPNIPEFSDPKFNNDYDMIHICIPFSEKFEIHAREYCGMSKNIVIHSTVMPGTSKHLGFSYSPIRGIHNNMYEHLKWFQKYYAGDIPEIEFSKRFPNYVKVDDTTKLERTKVVATSYVGVIYAFRKYIDSNYPVYWHFSNELHQMFGNQPVVYNDNKPIGGHCIIPNLDLLGDKLISDFVKKWGVDNA